MDPELKKHVKDRPFALSAARIAEDVSKMPIRSEQAQVATTAMIAWAILDHADAVRELTATLERQDGDA
ncbi:hypothetical protein DEU31_3039 [Brachybacterium sp. AG952]|uniref:hypothetical protein n=1 Tax=Brachybacterium sp. AG952 TaxID=2183989 RepID=UPI00105C5715|nr:hypothetical protein [Brachybacterium sp. AG952]TDP76332.1 hypothetical protein DEU31_3039 [Brachybacterium sp. AG952]